MRLAMPSCVPLFASLLCVAASCAVCKPPTYDADGYASAQTYSADIAACYASSIACDPLCRDALSLSNEKFIVRCAITSSDASGGVTVHARYADTTTCGAGDIEVDGVVYDDTTTDSADDGSTDDGSTSDGGDSGDSGDSGDDGGGDDLLAPPHRNTVSVHANTT